MVSPEPSIGGLSLGRDVEGARARRVEGVRPTKSNVDNFAMSTTLMVELSSLD